MMPRKSILGIVISLGFFAGMCCQPDCNAQGLSSVSPWPMFHHDQKHTGKTTNLGTRVGALKWRFKTDGQVVSSPAIAEDGTVYVGSDDNYVYAINRDGSLKWRYKTGGIVRSSPAVAEDGTIYVGSFDGMLYALNSTDGTVNWTYQTGNGIESSPAIAPDGTIYVGSSDGNLYAIDANGNLLWSTLLFGTSNPLGSSPAIADDGTVYIGCWTRDLFAVNQSGDLLWEYPTYTGGVFSSPTIAGDGSIYIANDQAWNDALSDLPKPYNEPWYIHRINMDGSTGILIEYGNADVYSTIAVEADTSFFTGYGQDLLAAHPNGQLNWTFSTNGKVDSSPIIGGDGIVYVGSDDGFFYAVDPNCACAIWQYETGGCIKSSAAIDNDSYRTIYVGSQDNYLYAFYDGFKIAGQVTHSGIGLSGVTMTLTSDYLTEPVVTLTDAQGKYDFPGLISPLTYTVTPTKPGYFFNPVSKDVTIQDTSQENVNFTTAAGFTVSGLVSVEGGGGLSGVTVILSGILSVTTQTDFQGNYSFSNVYPGTYTVTPSKQGYGFSPPSQSLIVSESNLTGINFTAVAGYSISGRVTSNGSGLSGVTMTLTGDDNDSTETGSDGNYSFIAIANGSYVVTPSKAGYEFDPVSQDVTVEDASEAGIDFLAESVTGPVISFIAPITGKRRTLVNIIGSNFGDTQGNACKVNFGETTAKIKFWSTWKILVRAPKGKGTVPVSVTTNEGTSNATYFSYIK